MEKFNERIKRLRIENKLSQEQLAEKIGLNRSAISLWESGKREPNARAIIALSKCFGVTSDYLLGLSD